MIFLPLIKKDLLNIKGDKLVFYMFLIPIIISVIIKIFLPSLTSENMKLYVSGNIPSEIYKNLENYFDITVAENDTELKSMVSNFDDIPGIDYKDKEIKLLFQGNEDSQIKNIYSMLVYNSLNGFETDTDTESLGNQKSGITEMIISMIIIFVISLSGVITGFTMVDDKTSHMTEAIAVAPVKLTQYIFSKIIITFVYSVIMSFISQIIITGINFNFYNYLLIMLSGIILSLVTGFLIGTFADSQNMAITYTKTVTFIMVFLPMISLLVPENIRFVFGIIPSYWTFRIIWQLYLGINGNLILSFTISIIYNIMLIVLIMPKMRKKFGLRLR